MASLIAWLDSTPEEQRLARELIQLFTQREGRDELGIGQIRDAFSDEIFPGTSVIQTRARYFLFVPWCYSSGRAARAHGAQVARVGEIQERELIKTLLDAGLEDAVGLIGRRVGPTVKTLPSTIYWSGLRRYGILAHDGELGLLVPAGATHGATELSERVFSDWDPGLPPPPAGFPKAVPGGFALVREEAEWLAERITSAAPGSVLAHLIDQRAIIARQCAFVWDVVSTGEFEVLDHAYLFSSTMHGASLLYNLLVGEAYDAHPALNAIEEAAETYRERIDEWVTGFVEPELARLQAWDLDRMWQLVLAANPRIDSRAQGFVETWVGAMRSGGHARLADNKELRQLVRAREERKGKLSRLLNDRMLSTWSGASGSAQLDFRWATVRGIVNDIVRGLDADAGT